MKTITAKNALKPALLFKSGTRKAGLKTATDVDALASKAKANAIAANLQISYTEPHALAPDKRRVRKPSLAVVRAVAKVVAEVGFVTPIVVADGCIIDGHARWEAAKRMDMPEIPVVDVSHLSVAQRELVKVALNRTAELGEWDLEALRESIIEIEMAGFEVETTGFSLAEIDAIKLDPMPVPEDGLNDVPEPVEEVVSVVGDCWQIGKHRLLCGSATDADSYKNLLGSEKVTLVLTDPPYNVKIGGNVSGLGKTKHGEFVQATGEMTPAEFDAFLEAVLTLSRQGMVEAGVAMAYMDWRHIANLVEAGGRAGLCLINMAVWDKQRGGMGGLYRSAHELVAVFCNGTTPAVNNVKLGANGRDRTNVWSYPGATTPGSSAAKALSLHPTPKPVEMLVDAMLDVSNPGDIILDPFMGSGSTIIAGEESGRQVRGIELDPKYVDCAIRRWEQLLGQDAVLIATGQTFAEVAAERNATLWHETSSRLSSGKAAIFWGETAMTFFQGRHDDEPQFSVDRDRSDHHRPAREHDESTRRIRRDERGKFIGCGNPKGRPRKVKLPPPASLTAAIAVALDKDVPIRLNGKLQTMTAFEAVASKLVHAMLSSGDPRAIVQILRLFDRMGALDLVQAIQDYKDDLLEQRSAPGWTEELEAKFRVVEASFDGLDNEPDGGGEFSRE